MIYQEILAQKLAFERLTKQFQEGYNHIGLCAVIMHDEDSNRVRAASDVLMWRIASREYDDKTLAVIRNSLRGHAVTLEGFISQEYRISQIDKMIGVAYDS